MFYQTELISLKKTKNLILVKKAQEGDREAFSELIHENTGKLRSVIKRIEGHPEDTNELYQETLLKAWRSLSSYRGEAEFSTWLCAIGARLALDFLRKKRQRKNQQLKH